MPAFGTLACLRIVLYSRTAAMVKTDPKVCAYCTKEVLRIEREHVFPRAWYPRGYIGMRMTVPSCGVCNREYGKVEDRLFFPLVACLPLSSIGRGLLDRAMNAFDPELGNSVRDVSYRRARIDRQMRVITCGETVRPMWTPRPLQLHQLTTQTGLLINGAPSVEFREEDVLQLATKLVKGCYAALSGRVLPSEVPIDAGAFVRDPRPIIRDAAARGLTLGGVFPFQYGLMRADDRNTLWFFSLWGFITLYGMTGSFAELPRETEATSGEVVLGLAGGV
jgi:hypothetical protein